MPTSFSEQRDRERHARVVLGEIEMANQDALERYTTANGLDLVERMQHENCLGITEPQLDFLKIIRDRLLEKGAI